MRFGPVPLHDATGAILAHSVDPGNLLFFGALGPRPVIGLPGCARSPALNGADWVLARIACGLRVTAADIAAMGIGGLLKEIPTRPMPRAGRGS
jgi:molybdenum cofactor cytidylyltransferase